MRISIFGLGYVGAVTAGCLARRGHTVLGADVQTQKVELLNQGVAPIVEPGLAPLIEEARARDLLRATTQSKEAVLETDVSIVSVGTPSTMTGSLDLSHVRQVLKEIAGVLEAHRKAHTIILRSTMLPGSTGRLFEEYFAGASRHSAISVYYHPEFLRESSAIEDFENPSLAVVGSRDGARPPADLMKALFGSDAEVVDWSTAEMIKYACNAFHAAKIAFANEMGRIAKPMNLDGRKVMELLCRDHKLNLSSYYLRPGNPFGGSCLTKDVRALMFHARQHGLTLPLLEGLLPSNERHLQNLLQVIVDSQQREVVILGLSFKANTDDLRESAMVEVAQNLLGRGYLVRIYDPALNLAALMGSNKRVIDAKMPHLASLLHTEVSSALGTEGLIVVAQPCVPAEELARHVTSKHQILDVNGWPALESLSARYDGFCW